MPSTLQSTDDMARVIEVLTKDNEYLRKEIQHLYEEIDLIRMRIPTCPCGNTMVSMTETENYK
jgi:hypothetical protein